LQGFRKARFFVTIEQSRNVHQWKKVMVKILLNWWLFLGLKIRKTGKNPIGIYH